MMQDDKDRLWPAPFPPTGGLTSREAAQSRRKMTSRGGRAVSSQFKGVSWSQSNHRWQGSILAEGKRRFLGLFKTEIAGAVAYDEAARELFGEHARLNFPDGVDPAALREAMETENYEAPFPPPGMMGRHEACRVFEVSITTWVVWERKGRVQCGQWVPVPGGKPGRCKVYPIDEINRLLEEYQRIGKPYADPDRAGCCRVPLRSLIHQYEAIISAEDLPLVEGRNWNWAPRSNSESGRVTLATMTGPQTPLCRIITGANGYGARVMHLNGDPLDCRRENLIVRTCAEQTYTNRKRSTTNGEPCSSRYKGVSWDRKREKWVAQIVKDKQHHHLGRFGDELAAAEAYDEAARELFGEHARLNFPEGVDVALAA